jgi:hypothetical protein
MPFGDRLKSAPREAPWCTGFALAAGLIWLLTFFGVTAPMELLGGVLDVPHAWRWVTYPLANPVPPSSFIWMLLGLVFFVLFISDLERRWGSPKFLRIFVILTLLGGMTEWLAFKLAASSAGLTGLEPQLWSMRLPVAALFMVWFALHQEATILLMLVLPIKAKYLAILDVVVMFFDNRGPIFGIAGASLLCLVWLWATRYESRAVQAPPGGSRRSLSRWWSDRQRARRKGKFQVLDGGSVLPSTPRVGNLQSLAKAGPPPKEEEPQGKELDRILDKIRFEGMNSLTEAEKAALDNQSRRLRGDP